MNASCKVRRTAMRLQLEHPTPGRDGLKDLKVTVFILFLIEAII